MRFRRSWIIALLIVPAGVVLGLLGARLVDPQAIRGNGETPAGVSGGTGRSDAAMRRQVPGGELEELYAARRAEEEALAAESEDADGEDRFRDRFDYEFYWPEDEASGLVDKGEDDAGKPGLAARNGDAGKPGVAAAEPVPQARPTPRANPRPNTGSNTGSSARNIRPEAPPPPPEPESGDPLPAIY